MRNPILRNPAPWRGAGILVSGLTALAMAALAVPAAASAQVAGAGPRCSRPDSIAVRGVVRVAESTALGDIGLARGTEIGTPQIQGAIRRLYETKQYDDVRASCELEGGRATLVFALRERPVLADVDVAGAEAQSERAVRDKVDLLIGQPLDPAAVARAVQRIDSVYQARGFYLARIRPESTTTNDGRVRLLFRIDEGRRLAISGVTIKGNTKLSDNEIVSSMQTKPEGFLWFRRGSFDEEKYAGDLSERIPQLYAKHGYIDFQIVDDTLVVDRERGKGLIELTVKEGEQYRLGNFEIVDNRRFSTEELERYYPFNGEGPTLTTRAMNLVRGRRTSEGVFDQSRWEEATDRVRGAYRNEGYIYASIQPIVERERVGPDSQPVVNLRWQIDERQPAIINRVDIAGNDYTSDECIRRQIQLIPGDVFNQDRLLRSWQSIGNLNFFETPLPFPETPKANDQGDLDVVFRVKEKRTGSINFGASMGGAGIGVGGFIGVDQPNLFGLCKRGSLNWNFGRYINDFNLTYQDPAIRKSRVSGSISGYRSLSRYNISGFGQNTRTGTSTRIGLPVPGSYFTTLGISYAAEASSFENVDPAFLIPGTCTRNCFRSNLGVDLTHDTRAGTPFPFQGGLQQIEAGFTGGPLGGTVAYQRYTGEFRAYAPLGQFGGGNPGSEPKVFVLGLTGRFGAIFGDPGPFFQYQSFALGGVQFGQALRGYPEFSITPRGFDPRADNFSAASGRDAFGNAFMTLTAEVGLRFNQQFYLNAFYDAGNNFARPKDFNPTRLFRGAGFGLSVVTPLGPLGLDWAYGFDRRSLIDPANPALGTRPDPKWQLHFKLGQLF
jgi:outer membrane protein insertion porin family